MNVFHSGASDCQWLPDGTGITHGDDVGGDDQVGESFSVRFRRADRPRAMITRTAYLLSVDDGPVWVRVRTEWLVGANPDDLSGSERWSDPLDEVVAGPYETVVEAEGTARNVASELLRDVDSLTWDGLPQWGPSDD